MPQKPVIRLRLKETGIPQDEQVEVLKAIEYKLLKDFKLKGITNIKKVFMKKDRRRYLAEDGSIKAAEEWLLETDGSNLKEILGIEAARQSIIKEIKMILDVYGIYINQRHLITLADLMSRYGEIKPISRHGLNRICEGPFRKASFEQTVEQLFSASVYSEVQQMFGITENIIFGQLAPLGTGSFKLLIDREEVKQAKYVPDDHNNKPGDLEMQYQDNENYEDVTSIYRADLANSQHCKNPGPRKL